MPNSPIFLPEKVKEAAYSWGLGWAESLCQIHGTKESKYYGMNDHNSGEKKMVIKNWNEIHQNVNNDCI